MSIPRPRARSDWLEWGITAVVLATAVAEACGLLRGATWNGPLAVVLVFVVVSIVPLATMGAHPVGSMAIAAPAFSTYALAFGLPASTAGVFVVILLAFGAGRYRGPRERWVLAGLVGVFVACQVRTDAPAFSDSSALADVLFILGIMVIPFVGGRVVANRQRLADQLRAQQPLVARAAVVDERARIARELHDAVAHSVSVMVIQSVAGRTLLRRDPDRAEEALHAVESTGKEALAELRRLLGVLRTTGEDDHDGLQPRPGLADLGTLVAGAQRSGVIVDVSISGECGQLAAGVDLAAYRIVQEALTNVIRHASTDRARVTVAHRPRALTIEVVDEGQGSQGRAPEHGGGHGLPGMRERAALYGGELHAGPRDEGGYAVRVDLPLDGDGLMSIRVLIADDQALVRTGFRLILEAEEDLIVVGEAPDGEHAVALAQRTAPDVCLMDVRMPVMDGITATRHLLALPAPPRVVMLTTFDLDEHVLDALRAGASGFLLKDVSAAELGTAVRVVAHGDALLSPRITRKLLDRFERLPGAAEPPPGWDDVTPREREVFTLVAEGRSNTEIGHALHLSEPTIKTHVGRLLRKLGVRDRVQLVVLAYRCGLAR